MIVWQADELDEYAGECYDRTNEILFTSLGLAKDYCERQWRKEAAAKSQTSKPSPRGVPDMFARPLMRTGPYRDMHEIRWTEKHREHELHAFNSAVQKFLQTPYRVTSRTIYEEIPNWDAA